MEESARKSFAFMGSVTKRFAGRASAPAKVNGTLFIQDLSIGIQDSEMTGHFQWATCEYFKCCVVILHVQGVSSVNPILRWVPSQ
jgi:hypothetical protein